MKNQELIKSGKEDLKIILKDMQRFKDYLEKFRNDYDDETGYKLDDNELIREIKIAETYYYPDLINSTQSFVCKAIENFLTDTKTAEHNNDKFFEVAVHAARMHKKILRKEIEKAQDSINQLDYLISVCDKYRTK